MPDVRVINNWKHHIFVRIVSNSVTYNETSQTTISEGGADLGLEVAGVGVNLGAGGATTETKQKRNIVDMQKVNAMKNKTRIEKSSHNVFPYPATEQHYLSISIYLGDDKQKYEILTDTSMLSIKRNTSFSITRDGALQPTGFMEEMKKKIIPGKDKPDPGERTEKPKADPFGTN